MPAFALPAVVPPAWVPAATSEPACPVPALPPAALAPELPPDAAAPACETLFDGSLPQPDPTSIKLNPTSPQARAPTSMLPVYAHRLVFTY